MQVNELSGERIGLRVIGLHCAEEVATLRRVLGRHCGVTDVHIDQVRARVSCRVASPATLAAVSTAVMGAGMRLVPEDDATVAHRAVDPTVWWAGVISAACLIAAFAAQVVESGGSWLALVAEVEPAGSAWVSTVLYAAAAAAASVVILPRTWISLRGLRLDMNVLVVIAVAGATWLGETPEAATVASLYVGAQLLEAWTAARARGAIGALMQGSAAPARCCVDGVEHAIDAADVEPGMSIFVRPGERIAVDGEVIAGSSSVDESAMSGEPAYILKRAGDHVTGGSVNGSGALQIKSTSRSDQATLARMLAAVAHAREGRTETERWVEQFARIYTPIVVGLALFIWLGPPMAGFGTWEEWFRRALVVTLVACPCALVISTPVTIVAAISSAARRGVLVKGGEHLERCAALCAVAFDKTGVTTTGRPRVVSWRVVTTQPEREVLEHVVALESHSEHPLAGALIDFARRHGVATSAVDAHDVGAVPGTGVVGVAFGDPFWIGSARFLGEHAPLSSDVAADIARLRSAGHSVVACGREGEVWAVFGIEDAVRPDAITAAAELRQLGITRLAMLSGDHPTAVGAAATAMRIDDVHGECTPEDKAAAVRRLAEDGPVAMIGDGINDVPALAAATLAVAVGPRATDAALEAADVVLVENDLRRLPWLIRHARRTLQVVRQNLWFAIGMKVAFLIAATTGEATLWMAVLADTGATLLVTANGLRLLHARVPSAMAHHDHHHVAAHEHTVQHGATRGG